MDDLKLATEQQLRDQYLEIARFIDQYESQMTEEQFNSPSHDYMFDDEQKRQRAIFQELQSRGCLCEIELRMGGLIDTPSDLKVTSE